MQKGDSFKVAPWSGVPGSRRLEYLRRRASQQDMLTCEDVLRAADEIERLCAENERLRTALEKIAGRREYDSRDHEAATRYKREEGIWSTDEYLADRALGDRA